MVGVVAVIDMSVVVVVVVVDVVLSAVVGPEVVVGVVSVAKKVVNPVEDGFLLPRQAK